MRFLRADSSFFIVPLMLLIFVESIRSSRDLTVEFICLSAALNDCSWFVPSKFWTFDVRLRRRSIEFCMDSSFYDACPFKSLLTCIAFWFTAIKLFCLTTGRRIFVNCGQFRGVLSGSFYLTFKFLSREPLVSSFSTLRLILICSGFLGVVTEATTFIHSALFYSSCDSWFTVCWLTCDLYWSEL